MIAYARSRMCIAKFSLICISSEEISLRTHYSNRSEKGVVFRTEYLFWGSTFGKRCDFPDGVPLLGATVREKWVFSGWRVYSRPASSKTLRIEG